MVIDTNEIIYIPESENKKNLSTYLIRNDIILSKTANAAASLVDIESCNTSQDTVAIKLKNNSQLISHYIVIYLNTSYGIAQMQRRFTGNIQMHLNLDDCRDNLLIPKFSNKFQEEIKELFENSINNKKKSQSLYTEAEALLLSELGLKDWKPTEETESVKSFSESFGQSGRLDAEYYQPKYDEIEAKIKGYKGGYSPLSFSCDYQDKIYIPAPDKKYKYIELSNIGNSGEINGCTEDLGKELPSRARRRVSTNDVIISSIEGSLQSCAIITPDYDKAICSTGFYVINSEKINPETLLILFKSFAMQALMKQICTGTILTAMNKDEFVRLSIPLIQPAIQQTIADKIQQSFALKAQSRQLLDLAKRGVEMAIERGEDEARVFIKSNSEVN